jgi:hypothetical protein
MHKLRLDATNRDVAELFQVIHYILVYQHWLQLAVWQEWPLYCLMEHSP